LGYNLVGGLEHGWIMTFHSVGNFIIPFDELHHFSEGWLNHQKPYKSPINPIKILIDLMVFHGNLGIFSEHVGNITTSC
jgi:hypothetical protein